MHQWYGSSIDHPAQEWYTWTLMEVSKGVPVALWKISSRKKTQKSRLYSSKMISYRFSTSPCNFQCLPSAAKCCMQLLHNKNKKTQTKWCPHSTENITSAIIFISVRGKFWLYLQQNTRIYNPIAAMGCLACFIFMLSFYKYPFRIRGCGWIPLVCPWFLQLVSSCSLQRQVSTSHWWANDWTSQYFSSIPLASLAPLLP